ncbi:unnamed protein product [Tetraodon nigroviridis]|uniref:(spotted green pufferfish) hypothetical protein n=1 Tax=Tetraodon nigroviridis TaxID=99883 RepID=Q4RRR4_TETNG|nr:unnamed protein product [Tetraodon nigroviridis]
MLHPRSACTHALLCSPVVQSSALPEVVRLCLKLSYLWRSRWSPWRYWRCLACQQCGSADDECDLAVMAAIMLSDDLNINIRFPE